MRFVLFDSNRCSTSSIGSRGNVWTNLHRKFINTIKRTSIRRRHIPAAMEHQSGEKKQDLLHAGGTASYRLVEQSESVVP
jgi:hypothetical protein